MLIRIVSKNNNTITVVISTETGSGRCTEAAEGCLELCQGPDGKELDVLANKESLESCRTWCHW